MRMLEKKNLFNLDHKRSGGSSCARADEHRTTHECFFSSLSTHINGYFCYFEGEATNLNLAHMMGYDCTNVEDLTKAEMEGREQAMYALSVSLIDCSWH